MAIIELWSVTKDYVTDAGTFRALDGVSMSVDAGEFVAVVGRSGSGKSTLLNMITGIDRATDGEVVVAGTDLGRLSEGRIARWRGATVGVVFQFFQLLPTLSVVENVMLPMDFAGRGTSAERYERAMALLDEVGMTDQADKLPLSTSGGQQQRVAIARALANDPPVLMADEPTGNLDTATADIVVGLFERLVDEGKTIMMVTHDADLAARTRRTIHMVDGHIVPEEVWLREHGLAGPEPGLAVAPVAAVAAAVTGGARG